MPYGHITQLECACNIEEVSRAIKNQVTAYLFTRGMQNAYSTAIRAYEEGNRKQREETVTVMSPSLPTGESWWLKKNPGNSHALVKVIQSLNSAGFGVGGQFTPQRSIGKNHESGLLCPTSPLPCTPSDLRKPGAFSPVLLGIRSIRGEIHNCPWNSEIPLEAAGGRRVCARTGVCSCTCKHVCTCTYMGVLTGRNY